VSFDDEMALLAADIQRWAGVDARIHDALEQLMKLHEAEVNALAFEALELDALLVRQTTELENRRIAERQPEVRWVDL
jgi:hypothetical protein